MIPFVDLKRELAEIGPELKEAIQIVMESGNFILGDEMENLEREFSNYVGTKYGVGTNSGSDALFLAIKALGIGRGDEVITVSHTFFSTVDAIARNGAEPIFVDIDPRTYCIDVSKIEEKISDRTRAIIPVHLYGHPADMRPMREIAHEYDLSLIEDACQAHGAEYGNMKAGSIGDAGCFSFYPTKNLGCYGDGGMVVTGDCDLYESIKMLRNYGQSKKHHQEVIGVNSRLDDLQAAILRVKLGHIDEWNRRRRAIARTYSEHLRGTEVKIPTEGDKVKHVYHLYVIAHKERDLIQRSLAAEGVQTQIHYPIPVHKQRAYLDLGYKARLPVTERASEEVLSIPMHAWLREDEALQIADIINDVLDRQIKALGNGRS